MAGEILADMIARAKPNSDEFSDIMYGVVESVSPLSVKVENRFTVSGNSIIVHEVCLEKKVEYEYPEITYTDEQLEIEGYQSLNYSVFNNYIKSTSSAYVVSSNGEDRSVSEDPFLQKIETDVQEQKITRDFPPRYSDKRVVTDFKVEVVKKEITIFEGLKVGERVRMIRGRSGQTFYIVGREVS